MNRIANVVLAMLAALSLGQPALAGGDDEPALSELVQILRKQGVLDEDEYETLTAKAAMKEEEHWYDRIEMWGDFRARYESFYFFKDVLNSQMDLPDRHRMRYRIRLNWKGHVNDYADVFVRLATGEGAGSARSTNRTLGASDDFFADRIFIRQAYVRASPFKDGNLPGETEGKLFFVFGRTPQVWRWDVYKEWIWDDEIDPAGFYAQTSAHINEQLELFGNGGLYIIDENQRPDFPTFLGSGKDPALTNMQVGFHAEPADHFKIGGKGSWYYFWNLNDPFITRGVVLGNTANGGLTGNPFGGTANVFQLDAYLKANLIEDWPMMVYGNWSINTSAHATPGTGNTGKQANTWIAGIDIGDPKKYVRFKMLYAWFEANAFPGQFVDSDLFDGFTNGKGWVWDVSRQVAENTSANVTFFLDKPIKKVLPGYASSLTGSERLRIQANMVFKF